MATRVASLYSEIGADTSGLKKGLKEIKSGLKTAANDFRQFGSVTNLTFTEISSAIGLASKAFGAAQGFIRDTAGEVVNYANQVRSLTAAIGATPQEASKLIQVADDVGISFEQLNSALEAGIRKGVKPTIDNLGRMSDEYLKLQPGIERTEFLMEKFGRTGTDLTRVMELGSNKIGEMGDSIEGTAMLMDQKALDAAENYRLALDALSDSVYNVKLGIGQGLIPELQKVADVMTRNIEITKVLNEAEDLGLINSLERTRAGSFLFGSEEANMAQVEEVMKLLEEYRQKQKVWSHGWTEYSKGINEVTMQWRSYTPAAKAAAEATGDAINPMSSLNRALEGTSRQMDGYSDGLPVAMELTRKLGQSSDTTSGQVKGIGNSADYAKSRLDILNGFDLNIAGTIQDELDRIKWAEIGGPALEQELAALPGRLKVGLISEPEYQAELKKLQGMAIVAQGEIDGLDATQTSQALSDQLGIPFTEADTLRATLETNLNAMTMREWVIKMRVDVTGYPPAGGGGTTWVPDMGLPGAVTPPGKGKNKQGGKTPGFASGGFLAPGMFGTVGEYGPEVALGLPGGGARVYSHGQSQNMATGGDTYVNLTINTLPGQDASAIAAHAVNMITRANSRARAGMSYAGV
jgi:hypothetical protein